MSQTVDPSGSQPLPATSNNALPPGTVVGDYTIQGLVGEGGFGIVYRAFDNVMQREIALKEYMPNALARRRPDGQVELRAPQYEATFHAGRRSFVNEARLLAQFDHKALVKVYRFFEANGTAYMVMPLYQGRTLKQILRESPGMDEAWLKSLIAPLLDALETLHGARCFHRDVAPDNILILDSGGPLLLDFGAARRIIGDMTQAVTVVIKPGYAPVEQYADDNSLQQGPWTDIYALAAVIRLAITGKPPATSVTRMVSDPVKPLAEIATGYSPQFLRAIDFGLAVRPEDRPQSIAEFREALGLSIMPARPVTPPLAAAPGAPASSPATPAAAQPVAPAAPSASPAPSATQRVASPVAPALKPVPPPLKPEATGPIGETVPMRQHRTMPPAPPTEAVKAAPAHPSIPVKPPPMGSSPPVIARPAPASVAPPRRQWVPIAVVVAMMLVVVGAGYFVMQAVTSPPSRDTVARAPASTSVAVTQPATAKAPAPEPTPPPAAQAAAVASAPTPPMAAPAVTAMAPAAPPPSAPAATPLSTPTAAPPPTPATASPAPSPAEAAPAAAAPQASASASSPPPASPPPPTGRVMLDIKPWGDVLVDGRPRGPSPPLKVLQLPEGAHRIEVRNPAGAALIRDVKVTAGGRVEISHTFK